MMLAIPGAPLFVVALAYLLLIPATSCFGYSKSPAMTPTTIPLDSTPTRQEVNIDNITVKSISAEDAQVASCFAIRNAVFIQEQQVPVEIEMDAYDKISTHILALCGEEPCGAARLVIIEKQDGRKVGKIGRVCVLKDKRGHGIGRKVMKFSIEELRRLIGTGNKAILGSQVHALEFYKSLGFELIPGEEYMAAGSVPHRDMELIL
jgi:ElaA protein